MDAKKSSGLPLLTFLFIAGATIAYLLQISPSPILSFIRDDFNLYNNDALLNMSMSIIFPFCIVACAIGTWVEQRVGTSKLYIIALSFFVLSGLIVIFANNFYIYLFSRAVYGIGFGLIIPFCGSAIMRWYKPKKREIMNTMNGMFPWAGLLGAFILLIPLMNAFGGSWKYAIAFWSVLVLIILILWIFFIDNKKIATYDESEQINEEPQEKGIYRHLWKRREIKLLCGSFVCDFFFYTYISALLPLFLMEAGNVSEGDASLMAAFAFPVVGVIGTILGGFIASKSGKRRPVMLTGQVLKVLGVIVMVFLIDTSVWLSLIGVVLFTLGNSSWLPPFYMVPMELKNMNPSRAAGAFSMMLSSGFIAATISPVLGGYLTDALSAASAIADPILAHVYGLKWSFFIFGFINVIAFICIWFLKETGPKGKAKSEVISNA